MGPHAQRRDVPAGGGRAVRAGRDRAVLVRGALVRGALGRARLDGAVRGAAQEVEPETVAAVRRAHDELRARCVPALVHLGVARELAPAPREEVHDVVGRLPQVEQRLLREGSHAVLPLRRRGEVVDLRDLDVVDERPGVPEDRGLHRSILPPAPAHDRTRATRARGTPSSSREGSGRGDGCHVRERAAVRRGTRGAASACPPRRRPTGRTAARG
ncbi:Uncharacterised protein [Mycobacteroides abscessus]|nr:Uncharacterised protein [Mycobacteroides abscessus]